jgi:hypothetical protein
LTVGRCRCGWRGGAVGGRELLLDEGEAVGDAALGGITRVHEIDEEVRRREERRILKKGKTKKDLKR